MSLTSHTACRPIGQRRKLCRKRNPSSSTTERTSKRRAPRSTSSTSATRPTPIRKVTSTATRWSRSVRGTSSAGLPTGSTMYRSNTPSPSMARCPSSSSVFLFRSHCWASTLSRKATISISPPAQSTYWPPRIWFAASSSGRAWSVKSFGGGATTARSQLSKASHPRRREHCNQ